MKPRAPSITKPQTFDAYLAALSLEKRAALEELRRAIREAAPDVEECISYGLAAFRMKGKFFVAIGGTARHCAFYLGSTVQTHAQELKGYATGKGTIRFQPAKPLPAVLVRKLIKARLREKGL